MSFTFAFGAFFWTDLIPSMQASFVVYASLDAIGSPLGALNLNLNCPEASLKTSKSGSAITSHVNDRLLVWRLKAYAMVVCYRQN